MALTTRGKIVIASCLRYMLFWTKAVSIQKKTILFFSFQGKSYACNPKYITEYIMDEKKRRDSPFQDVRIIWAFHNPAPYAYLKERGIQVVEYGSIAFYLAFFKAHAIVTNASNLPYLPVKRKQMLMNTWHGGGAYKSESFDSSLTNFRNRNVKTFLSSSEVFQTIMEKSTKLPSSCFLPCGMPRNDVFFHLSKEDIQKKKRILGLSLDKCYLLYAPTYRDDDAIYEQPDFTRILLALEERFGGQWELLLRGHYNAKDLFENASESNVIDLSSYDDMQDVLCVADAVITDYSSLIWDYSILHRPCFLFVPDEEHYQKIRGLYQPVERWNFPFARTNEELVECILKFDEQTNRENLRQHQKDLGTFETGGASETAAHHILHWLRNEV
ncbi:hypothetical protein HMPREF9334_01839 [Selenomonas infelix ATCC 43532]|uniref:CDP-glycerol:poly(Glycerophosphate) glycerophosphotransferase n=1 Tax=Selenomonas infelix ATCC 43532 TaxID=679201 RepID=G5GRF8_9FIRM|nr:CDP-glycerol glycerophosphotransferase family protein [Selenomonas infelix]EHG19524.1 hypothetical protein HMPREF9334_01839 [Selenomonas infelix ATCC 43532]